MLSLPPKKENVFNISIKLPKVGPKQKSCQKLSICYRNLNNITTHNIIKLSILKSYMSTNNFDIMCPSETYIDSSVPNNDGNLEITGYNLHRAGSPCNTKR